MKRRLAIELEVGEAAEGECRGCPFRALDWEGGSPMGRYICTCPAWEPQEVTTGRRLECLEAGRRAAQTEEALSRLDEWSLTFGADLSPGSRPDTFGEGMRKAKGHVRDLLLGRAGPGVR